MGAGGWGHGGGRRLEGGKHISESVLHCAPLEGGYSEDTLVAPTYSKNSEKYEGWEIQTLRSFIEQIWYQEEGSIWDKPV